MLHEFWSGLGNDEKCGIKWFGIILGGITAVVLLSFAVVCLIYVGWNSLPTYPHASRWSLIGTTNNGSLILENRLNGDIKTVPGEAP